MPISPTLLHKLQETLGRDATEDLVTWMEQADAHRGDIAELRHEMEIGFAKIDARFAQFEARIETLIEKRTSDLMKWSFVFWCGAVAAIAALAGVLRS